MIFLSFVLGFLIGGVFINKTLKQDIADGKVIYVGDFAYRAFPFEQTKSQGDGE